MSYKISSEQEDIILTRYKTGEPVADIWTAFGISKRSFYNIIKRRSADSRQVYTSRTPEEERAIADRYRAGESARDIASSTGVSYQTVYNILKRHKTEVKIPMTRLEPTDRRRLADACLAGDKASVAAEKFGVSEETVFKVLKEFDISLPQRRPPTCECDNTAFDVLTPEAEYWLGMLWTDGAADRSEGRVPRIALTLGEKDRTHVEKFSAFLKSTHAVTHLAQSKTALGGRCVSTFIRSERLTTAMRNFGFEKKRTRVPVPELVRSRDFWRGAVDGDGWLGTYVISGNMYPFIGLSGQMTLLSSFQNFLKSNSLAATKITPTESGVFRIQTSGSTAHAIIKTLYENVNEAVVLTRKGERAKMILSGKLEKCESYEQPAHTDTDTSLPQE